MPMNDFLKKQSVLALVASDFSYASNVVPLGATLKSFADNASEDEEAFPASLLLSFSQAERDSATSPFHSNVTNTGPNGLAIVEFGNWVVVRKFNNQDTGFGALILRSKLAGVDGKYQYIAAFRGTDGPNKQDWFANVDLAKIVWAIDGEAVTSFLSTLSDAGRIHFAGQSLGGALAQYAAYEFVDQLALAGRNFDPATLSLITFNAFGAVRGLREMHPANFDWSKLAEVETAHFVIENDVVHRLGAGNPADLSKFGNSWHLNGANNTYRFSFLRYDRNGNPIANPNGGWALPTLKEAHRIEPGFYRGLKHTGLLFSNATPSTIQYLDTSKSQSIAAAWSRVFNRGLTTESSAAARLAVGVAVIGIVGNPAELDRLTKALTQAAYNTGQITALQKEAIDRRHIGHVAGIAVKLASVVLGAASLVVATAIEMLRVAPSDAPAVFKGINQFLKPEKQLPLLVGGSGRRSDAENSMAYGIAMLNLASVADALAGEVLLADREDHSLLPYLRKAHIEHAALASSLFSGPVLSSALSAIQAAAGKQGFSADELVELDARLMSWAQMDARRLNDKQPGFLGAAVEQLKNFILTDFAKALANAHPDFTAKYAFAGSLFSSSVVDAVRYDAFESALSDAVLQRRFPEINELLQAALDVVDAAGQSVAITQGTLNSSIGYATSELTSNVTENGVAAYVLNIPYEASGNGQRVKLSFSGDTANVVRLLTDGQEIRPSNGDLFVRVDPHRRQESFAITTRGDFDADETVTVSATLVDANNQPTHKTHVELILKLDARQETDAAPVGITGTDKPEYLSGNGTVTALRGQDHIAGGAGNDRIFGGGGADFIRPGLGTNWVEGSTGGDFVVLGAGEDHVDGGADGDFIVYLGKDAYPKTIENGVGLPELGHPWAHGFTAGILPSGDFGLTSLYAGILVARSAPKEMVESWVTKAMYTTVSGQEIYGGGWDDFIAAGPGDDVIYGDGGTDAPATAAPDDRSTGGFGDKPPAPDSRALGGVGGSGQSGGLIRPDGTRLIPAPLQPRNLLDFGAPSTSPTPDFVDGVDAILAGAGNDTVFGQGETDYLFGGDGADYIDGGTGNDLVFGEAGADMLFGGEGDDGMRGDSVNDPVRHGNDYMEGGSGVDWMWGEGGADTLFGGDGDDYIEGDGAQIPVAYQGADYLDGGAGNDLLFGFAADDEMFGGNGNDELEGNAGDDYLDGDDGIDRLFGDEGADQLFGGPGNDDLQGGAGNDYLDGEADNDLIHGDAGDDQAFGGGGADGISGGPGADVLHGDDGNDLLNGDGEADTLYGEAGSDSLQGDAGNDALFGGADDDVLNGGDGDDVLEGGRGRDALDGGAGNDTYVFRSGDGVERVVDAAGVTRFQFADLAGPDGFSLTADLQDATNRVQYGGADLFTFTRSSSASEQFEFADGTVLGWSEMVDRAGRYSIVGSVGDDRLTGGMSIDVLSGSDGNDTLDAGGGADWLSGGLGNDILQGGPGDDQIDDLSGSDTFIFGIGDGTDVVTQRGIGSEVDTLRLRSVSPDDVALVRIDENLKVLLPSGESITFVSDFRGTGASATQIEEIRFDGTVWGRATIRQKSIRPTAGDDILSGFDDSNDVIDALGGGDSVSGGSGNDMLSGGTGNDRLDGGEGNDTIDGGAGDDNMGGGTGADTYTLGPGFGRDSIRDEAGADAILFGSGILPAQLQLNNGSVDELVIKVRGSNDELLMRDAFSASGQIEQIKFASDPAAVWSAATLKTKLFDGSELRDVITGFDSGDVITGLAGDDWIRGGTGSDSIDGGDGADRISGEPGNDSIQGGEGADLASGDEGNDVVRGGAGDDTVEGGADADHLYGNAGNDRLIGGGGSDTYYFGRGDGQDSIVGSRLSGDVDVLQFDSSVSPADVVLTQGPVIGSLTVAIKGTVDAVAIDKQFDPSSNQGIEYIRFVDPARTVWNRNIIRSKILAATPGPDDIRGFDDTNDVIAGLQGDDAIVGNGGNDTLDGGDGSDRLSGGDGADVLNGGAGNDQLSGGAGDDVLNGGDGDDSLYAADDSFNLDSASPERNRLSGGAGNDTLYAGRGADVLDGGPGDDFVSGGAGSDTFLFGRGSGRDQISDAGMPESDVDTLQFTGSVTAGDLVFGAIPDHLTVAINGTTDIAQLWIYRQAGRDIERLALPDGRNFGAKQISIGTSAADSITASDARGTILIGGLDNDVLTGAAGNDLVNGGYGIDTMAAAGGDDTYVVDIAADMVNEGVNRGNDTIESFVSYSLPVNVEHLRLLGNAVSATGNALNNLLIGNALSNRLDGGAGADALIGGAGNDTYVVDAAGDAITERAGEGTDTVESSISFTLNDPNLENLTLVGVNSIVGRGNAASNTVIGNSANNTLYGGAGNDTLIGGAGSDMLIPENGNDLLDGGDGNDGYVIWRGIGQDVIAQNDRRPGKVDTIWLYAGVAAGDLTFVANGSDLTIGFADAADSVRIVNQLVPTGAAPLRIDAIRFADQRIFFLNDLQIGANGNDVLVGTAQQSVLIGSAGSDIIDGGAGADIINGGAGADQMKGGAGDDIFVVDDRLDVVTEALPGDGIDTVQSFIDYTAVANVENVTLLGNALNAVGNSGDNFLLGNAGKNALTGGAGNDLLHGAADTDTLAGDAGNDVLDGMDGDDRLFDTAGNNVLRGGTGADTVAGAAGNELLIGGVGNDTLTTGVGRDIVAFNRGDGKDVVNASAGTDNTLSLGGGIRYADMSLTRTGNDLQLNLGGAGDSVTFKDWYAAPANRSVLNMQVIAEAMADFNAASADPLRNRKVETFNFANIVNAFDASGVATAWALTDTLLRQHLASSSDSAAIGADLAYRYGRTGSLAGMGFDPVVGMLSNGAFGVSAQALQAASATDVGARRLA